MLACLSPNGGVQYAGSEALQKIKIGTIEGIYTLERQVGDSSWRQSGNVRPDLHISSLLYEPQSGALLAGAHGGGGLWRSDDEGMSWRQLTAGLINPHIYSIQCQHVDGKVRLWVGAEPASLFLSDDLGETWIEREGLKSVPEHENWCFPPPPHIAHVKGVAWHDSEPDTLFVLVEQGGLFKTTDAGLTWTEMKGYLIGDQQFYRDSHRVCIPSSDPNRIYFATGDGLCRSLDGGETWEYLLTKEARIGYPDAMFIDPHNENKLVIGGPSAAPQTWRESQFANATVMVSHDGGDSWSEKTNGMNAPLRGNIEAMGVYASSEAVAYMAGTAIGQVFLSEDGCETWDCLADDLPPISKAGHYRWFLTEGERARIEERMSKWKDSV